MYSIFGLILLLVTFCLLDKIAFCDHLLLCFMKVVVWHFLGICLFDFFGFHCQGFHCCFWLLRVISNTFIFVGFSSIEWCWFAKVFNFLFFNHKFQCCWEHFLKRLFVCCFEENLLRILVLLSWTCFSFDFLLVKWKCFMFVLELVFSV